LGPPDRTIPFGVELLDEREIAVPRAAGVDLAIHVRLAHAARDQLRELPTVRARDTSPCSAPALRVVELEQPAPRPPERPRSTGPLLRGAASARTLATCCAVEVLEPTTGIQRIVNKILILDYGSQFTQ